MIFVWIAAVLSFLAFLIHTFIGDKELRMLRPKLGIDATLIEKWIMGRAAWHWVSFDLLLISVILLTVCLTSPLKWTPIFLKAFACCLFAVGCIWLAVVAMSEKLRKKYINLGQWILLWVIGLLVFIGANIIDSDSKNKSLNHTVKEYYQTYKERKDFDKFLSFYDESIVLEDMIGGFKTDGKQAFAEFFNWPDPRFEMNDSIALMVEGQIIMKNSVVTSGYFTPFLWDSIEVEAMQFTTRLEFNENHKIVRHVDWINYPEYLLSQDARQNSNEWIE